jgi:hypothetical protein
MLYPREDKTNRKLLFACRNCHFEEDADNNCVYRHEIVHAPSYVFHHCFIYLLRFDCSIRSNRFSDHTTIFPTIVNKPWCWLILVLIPLWYVFLVLGLSRCWNVTHSYSFQCHSHAPPLPALDAVTRKRCFSSRQRDEQILKWPCFMFAVTGRAAIVGSINLYSSVSITSHTFFSPSQKLNIHSLSWKYLPSHVLLVCASPPNNFAFR